MTVLVERRARHAQYGKTLLRSKSYLVHDETSQANIGDLVTIREGRPLSKLKRFTLVQVLERNKRAAVALASGESVVVSVFKKPESAAVEAQS